MSPSHHYQITAALFFITTISQSTEINEKATKSSRRPRRLLFVAFFSYLSDMPPAPPTSPPPAYFQPPFPLLADLSPSQNHPRAPSHRSTPRRPPQSYWPASSATSRCARRSPFPL